MKTAFVPDLPCEISTVPLKYDRWRKHQKEAVSWLVGALKQWPVAALDAPCGAGKSLLSIAVAGALGYRAIYVTGTRQLQAQIAADFPETVIIWGREHFPCLWNAGMTAAECMHDPLSSDEDDLCPVTGDCPYLVRKTQALNAQVACLSYAYLLAEANHAGGFHWKDKSSKYPGSLLILDEGDTAADELSRHVSIVITGRQLARCGLQPPRYVTSPESWREWAVPAAQKVNAVASGLRQELSCGSGKPSSDMIRLYRSYKNLAGKLTEFSILLDDSWVYELDKPDRWEFKPAWVSGFGQKLTGHADKVLGMSATMLSASLWAKDLGLDTRTVCFRQIPSTFPKEHRPFCSIPVADFSRKEVTDESMQRMVQVIDSIMDDHKDEKGVIHAISYSTAQYIQKYSKHQDRIVSHEDGSGRAEVLKRHVESDEPTVLMSPSFTRGLDLPDDLCLVPGTLVCTSKGWIPIEGIKVGDHVLTHRGLFKKVLNTSSRPYVGEIITIKGPGGFDVSLTPGHPVLISRAEKSQYKQSHLHRYENHYAMPGWKPAGEIGIGDWVLFPVLKYARPFSAPGKKWLSGHTADRGVLRHQWANNTDFWELVGIWAAEGSMAGKRDIRDHHRSGQNPMRYRITFSLGPNERDFALHVCGLIERVLGNKVKPWSNSREIRVIVKNDSFALWLKSRVRCGSRNKRVPFQLLAGGNPDNMRAFTAGWLAGDGHIGRKTKKNDVEGTSVSPDITLNVQLMLHSLGIRSRVSKSKMPEGYSTSGKPAYDIRFSTGKKQLTWFAGNKTGGKCFTVGRVTSSTTSKYVGLVYNISVDRDESYVLPNLCVHNCRFQILARIPFLSLGDKQTLKRRWSGKRGEEWYVMEAVRNVVQAYGRSTRSAEDHSETIILDARWDRFYSENKALFPGWFREAVV